MLVHSNNTTISVNSALAGEYEYQSGRDKKDTDEFLQAASGYFKKAASDVHLHASTQFDILDKVSYIILMM